MEEMKKEFEEYLRQLVASQREADEDIHNKPADQQGRLRNFIAEAEQKMYELISNARNISATAAKLELTSLTVKYHQILLNEVL